MNKICRICWNTRDWRQPTGEAAKLEMGGTYVQTQGYGLEEWLFNFAWRHPDGKKYGYLQPIGKYRSKYEGATFDILVYARNPAATPLAIARLGGVSVLDLNEATNACRYMNQRGWLKQMQRDIDQLPRAQRLPTKPEQIVNVKFDPERVYFFDPPRPFPRGHATYRNVRYQPLNLSDRNRLSSEPDRNSPAETRKSEGEVFRKAVAATSYDPMHNKIQNALKVFLSKQHGSKCVGIEIDGVDVLLHTGGTKTFFEIKTHVTAKSCIREALGQLLEYAVYPASERADRLEIVGDGKPTADDAKYLQYLRSHLPLPVFYSVWNWKNKQLERGC